jgi:hypothetical protein
MEAGQFFSAVRASGELKEQIKFSILSHVTRRWLNVLREECEKNPSAAEAALIQLPGGTAKAVP